MKRLLILIAAAAASSAAFAQPALPDLSKLPPTVRELIEEKLRDPDRLSPSQVGALEKQAATLDGVETLVSGDNAPESEVHAAMNPLDTNNIIASPIRQDGIALTCPIYFTRDFGATWRKSQWSNRPLDPSHRVLGGGDPVLSFDADGKAYFTWIALFTTSSLDSIFWGIYWAVSTDGGETWARQSNDRIAYAGERAIYPYPYSLLSLPEVYDKQWIAVDRTSSQWRGQMYAALVAIRIANGSSEMRVYRKPAGEPFEETYAVVSDSNELMRVQFSSIDFDRQGGVHVSFFGIDFSGEPGLWHCRSTDGGRTFSPARLVSKMHVPRFSYDAEQDSITGVSLSRIYPSPHLIVDRSNGPYAGTIYTTWSADGITERGNDGLDIYFSRSTDNGATWSAPTIVNDDERGLARHQFHPCIGISPSGVVTVGWYDRRASTNDRATTFRLAHSSDGGRTFTANRNISTTPTDFGSVGERNGGFGVGEYNAVVSTDYNAIPFWADGRFGDGDLDIYTAVVPLDGVSAIERLTTLTERIVLHDPRPVGDALEVRFDLAAPSHVRLVVVDVRGTVEATLIDGERGAGTSSITLDRASLPAGAHMLQLTSREGVACRKFLVAP